MAFKIISDGDHSAMVVGNRLVKSGRSIHTMKGVMDMIVLDMMVFNEANIRSEGRRGGGSYERLKPSTILRKGDSTILYTTGALKGYTRLGNDTLVKSVTQPNAPYQINNTTNTTIEFGTSRPYARLHQFGAERDRGDLPARPFLAFRQKDADNWKAMIAAHLLEALRTGDGDGE